MIRNVTILLLLSLSFEAVINVDSTNIEIET